MNTPLPKSIKIITVITFITVILTLTPKAFSGHLQGEGWFCEGGDVVYENDIGGHQYWEQCSGGTTCLARPNSQGGIPAGYSADADCLIDSDGDDIANERDPDDDNDGIPDNQDNQPLVPTQPTPASCIDNDHDGICRGQDGDDNRAEDPDGCNDYDGIPDPPSECQSYTYPAPFSYQYPSPSTPIGPGQTYYICNSGSRSCSATNTPTAGSYGSLNQCQAVCNPSVPLPTSGQATPTPIPLPPGATLSAGGSVSIGSGLPIHSGAFGDDLIQMDIVALVDGSFITLTSRECAGASCALDYIWYPGPGDAGKSFKLFVTAFSENNTQCSGNPGRDSSYWSDCDSGEGDFVDVLVEAPPEIPVPTLEPVQPPVQESEPPTGSLFGPTQAIVGDRLIYSANSTGDNLDELGVWVFDGLSWEEIQSVDCYNQSSCNLNAYWVPEEAGQYLITINAFDHSGKKCSGNPGFNPLEWSDCIPGESDLVRVNVSPLPLPSQPGVTIEPTNICTPGQYLGPCKKDIGDEICINTLSGPAPECIIRACSNGGNPPECLPPVIVEPTATPVELVESQICSLGEYLGPCNEGLAFGTKRCVLDIYNGVKQQCIFEGCANGGNPPNCIPPETEEELFTPVPTEIPIIEEILPTPTQEPIPTENPLPTITSLDTFINGRKVNLGSLSNIAPLTITFVANVPPELGSDFACRWDTGLGFGDYSTCSLTQTFNSGNRTVSVYVVNNAGQQSQTQTISFTIISPTPTPVVQQQSVTTTTTVTESFNCYARLTCAKDKDGSLTGYASKTWFEEDTNSTGECPAQERIYAPTDCPLSEFQPEGTSKFTGEKLTLEKDKELLETKLEDVIIVPQCEHKEYSDQYQCLKGERCSNYHYIDPVVKCQDVVTSSCVKDEQCLSGPGQQCSQDSECKANFFCEAGTCKSESLRQTIPVIGPIGNVLEGIRDGAGTGVEGLVAAGGWVKDRATDLTEFVGGAGLDYQGERSEIAYGNLVLAGRLWDSFIIDQGLASQERDRIAKIPECQPYLSSANLGLNSTDFGLSAPPQGQIPPQCLSSASVDDADKALQVSAQTGSATEALKVLGVDLNSQAAVGENLTIGICIDVFSGIPGVGGVIQATRSQGACLTTGSFVPKDASQSLAATIRNEQVRGLAREMELDLNQNPNEWDAAKRELFFNKIARGDFNFAKAAVEVVGLPIGSIEDARVAASICQGQFGNACFVSKDNPSIYVDLSKQDLQILNDRARQIEPEFNPVPSDLFQRYSELVFTTSYYQQGQLVDVEIQSARSRQASQLGITLVQLSEVERTYEVYGRVGQDIRQNTSAGRQMEIEQTQATIETAIGIATTAIDPGVAAQIVAGGAKAVIAKTALSRLIRNHGDEAAETLARRAEAAFNKHRLNQNLTEEEVDVLGRVWGETVAEPGGSALSTQRPTIGQMVDELEQRGVVVAQTPDFEAIRAFQEESNLRELVQRGLNEARSPGVLLEEGRPITPMVIILDPDKVVFSSAGPADIQQLVDDVVDRLPFRSGQDLASREARSEISNQVIDAEIASAARNGIPVERIIIPGKEVIESPQIASILDNLDAGLKGYDMESIAARSQPQEISVPCPISDNGFNIIPTVYAATDPCKSIPVITGITNIIRGPTRIVQNVLDETIGRSGSKAAVEVVQGEGEQLTAGFLEALKNHPDISRLIHHDDTVFLNIPIVTNGRSFNVPVEVYAFIFRDTHQLRVRTGPTPKSFPVEANFAVQQALRDFNEASIEPNPSVRDRVEDIFRINKPTKQSYQNEPLHPWVAQDLTLDRARFRNERLIDSLATDPEIRALIESDYNEAWQSVSQRLYNELQTVDPQARPYVVHSLAADILDQHSTESRVIRLIENFDPEQVVEIPFTKEITIPKERDLWGLVTVNLDDETIQEVTGRARAVAESTRIPSSGQVKDLAEIIGSLTTSLADETTQVGKDQRRLINILYATDDMTESYFYKRTQQFFAQGGNPEDLPSLFGDLLTENITRYNDIKHAWQGVIDTYNSNVLPLANERFQSRFRFIEADPENIVWFRSDDYPDECLIGGFCALHTPVNDPSASYVAIKVNAPEDQRLGILTHETVHEGPQNQFGLYTLEPSRDHFGFNRQVLEELTERQNLEIQRELGDVGVVPYDPAYGRERAAGDAILRNLGIPEVEIRRFADNQDALGYIRFIDQELTRLSDADYREFINALLKDAQIGPAQRDLLIVKRAESVMDIRLMSSVWTDQVFGGFANNGIGTFKTVQARRSSLAKWFDVPVDSEIFKDPEKFAVFAEDFARRARRLDDNQYVPPYYYSQTKDGAYNLRFISPTQQVHEIVSEPLESQLPRLNPTVFPDLDNYMSRNKFILDEERRIGVHAIYVGGEREVIFTSHPETYSRISTDVRFMIGSFDSASGPPYPPLLITEVVIKSELAKENEEQIIKRAIEHNDAKIVEYLQAGGDPALLPATKLKHEIMEISDYISNPCPVGFNIIPTVYAAIEPCPPLNPLRAIAQNGRNFIIEGGDVAESVINRVSGRGVGQSSTIAEKLQVARNLDDVIKILKDAGETEDVVFLIQDIHQLPTYASRIPGDMISGVSETNGLRSQVEKLWEDARAGHRREFEPIRPTVDNAVYLDDLKTAILLKGGVDRDGVLYKAADLLDEIDRLELQPGAKVTRGGVLDQAGLADKVDEFLQRPHKFVPQFPKPQVVVKFPITVENATQLIDLVEVLNVRGEDGRVIAAIKDLEKIDPKAFTLSTKRKDDLASSIQDDNLRQRVIELWEADRRGNARIYNFKPINEARDFDELYSLLRSKPKQNITNKDGVVYEVEDLIEIIDDVRAGQKNIRWVTSAEDLRQTVRDLLRRENSPEVKNVGPLNGVVDKVEDLQDEFRPLGVKRRIPEKVVKRVDEATGFDDLYSILSAKGQLVGSDNTVYSAKELIDLIELSRTNPGVVNLITRTDNLRGTVKRLIPCPVGFNLISTVYAQGVDPCPNPGFFEGIRNSAVDLWKRVFNKEETITPVGRVSSKMPTESAEVVSARLTDTAETELDLAGTQLKIKRGYDPEKQDEVRKGLSYIIDPSQDLPANVKIIDKNGVELPSNLSRPVSFDEIDVIRIDGKDYQPDFDAWLNPYLFPKTETRLNPEYKRVVGDIAEVWDTAVNHPENLDDCLKTCLPPHIGQRIKEIVKYTEDHPDVTRLGFSTSVVINRDVVYLGDHIDIWEIAAQPATVRSQVLNSLEREYDFQDKTLFNQIKSAVDKVASGQKLTDEEQLMAEAFINADVLQRGPQGSLGFQRVTIENKPYAVAHMAEDYLVRSIIPESAFELHQKAVEDFVTLMRQRGVLVPDWISPYEGNEFMYGIALDSIGGHPGSFFFHQELTTDESMARVLTHERIHTLESIGNSILFHSEDVKNIPVSFGSPYVGFNSFEAFTESLQLLVTFKGDVDRALASDALYYSNYASAVKELLLIVKDIDTQSGDKLLGTELMLRGVTNKAEGRASDLGAIELYYDLNVARGGQSFAQRMAKFSDENLTRFNYEPKPPGSTPEIERAIRNVQFEDYPEVSFMGKESFDRDKEYYIKDPSSLISNSGISERVIFYDAVIADDKARAEFIAQIKDYYGDYAKALNKELENYDQTVAEIVKKKTASALENIFERARNTISEWFNRIFRREPGVSAISAELLKSNSSEVNFLIQYNQGQGVTRGYLKEGYIVTKIDDSGVISKSSNEPGQEIIIKVEKSSNNRVVITEIGIPPNTPRNIRDTLVETANSINQTSQQESKVAVKSLEELKQAQVAQRLTLQADPKLETVDPATLVVYGRDDIDSLKPLFGEELGGGSFGVTLIDRQTDILTKLFMNPYQVENYNQVRFYKRFGGQYNIPAFIAEIKNVYGGSIGFQQQYLGKAESLSEFKARGGKLTQAEVEKAIQDLKDIHRVSGQAHGDLITEEGLHENNILVGTLVGSSGVPEHKVMLVDYGGYNVEYTHEQGFIITEEIRFEREMRKLIGGNKTSFIYPYPEIFNIQKPIYADRINLKLW